MKDTRGFRLGWGKSWMSQAEDSILQVCQLTELKQTKEWERYPNQFRHLCETLLPKNLGKHRQEWPAGKTVRHQASHSRKQQTTRPHSVVQSPKTSQGGASLPWTCWSEGMTEMIFLKRMRAIVNQMNFGTVPKVTLAKLL